MSTGSGTSIFTHNAAGITTQVSNYAGISSKIELNERNQVVKLWQNQQLLATIDYDGKALSG